MEKIISIDAETDGLWGNPFSIAAIVYEKQYSYIAKYWESTRDGVVYLNETVVFAPSRPENTSAGISPVRGGGVDYSTPKKQCEKWVEVDKIILKMPDNKIKNKWVKDNVLPTLEKIEVTHKKYKKMLHSFSDFYKKHKEATTLWHMGHVVESFLFRECVRLGYIGEFEAPYTPIEVSEILRSKGFQPDSVDGYIDNNNIEISHYGNTHNPLHDCEIAAKVYFDLVK